MPSYKPDFHIPTESRMSYFHILETKDHEYMENRNLMTRFLKLDIITEKSPNNHSIYPSNHLENPTKYEKKNSCWDPQPKHKND